MSAQAPASPAPVHAGGPVPLRNPKLGYGGQAVLEGVMMRGRRFMAVAVRAPDRRIVITSEALPSRIYGGGIQKIPFLRGVTLLWDSLGLGMKALMFSAEIQMQGEETDKEAKPPSGGSSDGHVEGDAAANQGRRDEAPAGLPKSLAWTTVAVALIFGIGFFFVTPLAVVGIAEQFLGAHTLWSNLAEGIIRLLLLVGYVGLIGLMPDIRRVYMYHGAEHMTIHAWEHNDPLDPDHVARYSPAHPRCGTAFLLEVVGISIVLFALLGTPPLWIRVLERIVLIPVIAGIAYELLRLGGKHPNSPLMALVVAPGLALQALTTRYPDRDQMEVAIASMNELLKREAEVPATSG